MFMKILRTTQLRTNRMPNIRFTFSLERVRSFAYDNNRDLGKNGQQAKRK
jgi:hypothetical protein